MYKAVGGAPRPEQISPLGQRLDFQPRAKQIIRKFRTQTKYKKLFHLKFYVKFHVIIWRHIKGDIKDSLKI